MLFTCAPRAAAATRPASRKLVKRGNKSFAVDLHCHVHTPAADELAKQTEKPAVDPMTRYRNPRTQEHQQKLRAQLGRKLTSIEQRIADMDKIGIDVQAISTLKKIYFDTVVFSEAQLEHLVRLWGADHAVIGTDYPYDMGYYKPVEFVNGAKRLTRAQKEAIIGGNAAKLLKLKPPRKRKGGGV